VHVSGDQIRLVPEGQNPSEKLKNTFLHFFTLFCKKVKKSMKKASLLLVKLLFKPVQKVVLGTSKLQVKPL